MARLVLIRHARPEIDPDIPANEWGLSPEGRVACPRLAQALRHLKTQVVIASEEPKAAETGELVAQALNLPFQTAPGLHEHDRGNVIFEGDQAVFLANVRRFFEKPDQLVYGAETAHAACQRFTQAVHSSIADFPDRTVAIATHGTVMSLFVAQYNPIDVVDFWGQLKLPDAVVLARPGFEMVGTISQ